MLLEFMHMTNMACEEKGCRWSPCGFIWCSSGILSVIQWIPMAPSFVSDCRSYGFKLFSHSFPLDPMTVNHQPPKNKYHQRLGGTCVNSCAEHLSMSSSWCMVAPSDCKTEFASTGLPAKNLRTELFFQRRVCVISLVV